MIEHLGTVSLGLKCTDEDLIKIIDNYLNISEYPFSFKELCNYVISKADKNDYFEKKPNTKYNGIELQLKDIQTINIILWNKIWEKKLIIVLDQYFHKSYPQEFYFSKI
jgi:hypothetical protein